jgi:hypothetical protein
MDGLSITFAFLTVSFLLLLVGMTTINTLAATDAKENFENQEGQASAQPAQPADLSAKVSAKVRAVIDPMAASFDTDLCALYGKIREISRKNEMSGQQISEEEANRRVEKSLALQIPGGALQCPLVKYPRSGASPRDWLAWLQSLPDDFGSRVVFMAIYADTFLSKNISDLQTALKLTPETTQGFADICPPDVASSRRAEAAKRAAAAGASASCKLPEDATEADIESAITKRLETLVATKEKNLQEKSVDLKSLSVQSLLTRAKKNMKSLDSIKQQAESGTLAGNLTGVPNDVSLSS